MTKVIEAPKVIDKCKQCGKHYEKRGLNKFCSPECRIENNRAYAREYSKNYNKKPVEKIKANNNGEKTIISIKELKNAIFEVNRKMTDQEIFEFKQKKIEEHYKNQVR